LKLAAFLAGPVARAEKRSKHRKLDMCRYASHQTIGLTKKDCGTSACALGWATQVFPGHWDATNPIYPMLKRGSISPEADAMRFFGIDRDAVNRVFGTLERTVQEEASVLRKVATGEKP